jgi:hypothetical protein
MFLQSRKYDFSIQIKLPRLLRRQIKGKFWKLFVKMKQYFNPFSILTIFWATIYCT